MVDFPANRLALGHILDDDSVAIIPSASLHIRNNDNEFPFRQESSFYWLSGLNEPEAFIVLEKSRGSVTASLFSQPRKPSQELWTGKILGQSAAKQTLLFDEAYSNQELSERMPQKLIGKKIIYSPFGNEALDVLINGWLKEANNLSMLAKKEDLDAGRVLKVPRTKKDIKTKVENCRLIKSEAEIELIHKACQISSSAHIKLMQKARAGKTERYLQGVFDGECLKHGAADRAYPSIVGSAENGCCLHYVKNQDELRDGDLILIDAGCESEFYASDITRTFPVNGKYSTEQRQLYDIVLKAQLAGIEACKPGSNLFEVEKAASMQIIDGLKELGLLKGDSEALFESKAHKEFYPHSVGHWVGLDVHDPSKYSTTKGWVTFEPNMVLTVEPGIYVQPDNDKVPAKWRGIGIRIEDVVQITTEGCRVLSDGVIKEPQQIERLMREAAEKRAEAATVPCGITHGYALRQTPQRELQTQEKEPARGLRHT